MKSFLVCLKEKNSTKLDEKLLIKHIEHLKQLNEHGHLLVCGPFVDDSGAMLVVQATSKSDAEKLIQSDPFIEGGYYNNYSITEFYKADDSNNYLMDEASSIE